MNNIKNLMPLLTPEVTGIVVVSLLMVALCMGAHIGVALGLAGFAGIYLSVGPDAALAQIAAIPFGTTNSFALAVIPLFILMGSFATVSGITTDLFRTAYVWLGSLRGGLAMATVMSSAAFGAASGSTIVNAAVFTRMAMPEMARFGYDIRLSAGCIAAAGTLAALIWHRWPTSSSLGPIAFNRSRGCTASCCCSASWSAAFMAVIFQPPMQGL